MRSGFYYLRGDLTDKWAFSITRVELNGADPLLVYGLKQIEEWDERIRFYYSEYSIPPDFQIPMICPLHFVTKSFIDALSQAQLRCLNLIAIEIHPEDTGPVIEDYYIADYVYTFAALNIGLSRIIYEPEKPDEIITVPHIVLDKYKIPPNAHAFRLQESPSNIIISQEMVDNLEKHLITGTRFVPVEVG